MSVLMDKDFSFKIRAIAQYDELFEVSFFQTFENLTSVGKLPRMSDILKLIWCALIIEDPEIKPEVVGDMLEEHLESGGTMEEITNKLVASILRCSLFKNSLAVEEGEVDNAKPKKRSTSKNG